MITLEEYKKDILNNLSIMSRTANGYIDLSSSKDKVKSMATTDGELAKDRVFINCNKAIEFAYENRNRKFTSVNELKDFIETIALTINDGIVLENKLYRNGKDENAFNYVAVSEIENTLNTFLMILLSLFNDDNYDPLFASAVSEYYINYRGHFFSDGCFKTCMLVSAYCLMRADIKVASYVSRTMYFAYEPHSREDDNTSIIRHYEFIQLIHRVKDYIIQYQQETNSNVEKYDFFAFPSDDILTSVLEGKKTAISSLYELYEVYKTDLPFPGLYSVILDQNDIPKCIIVNRKMDIKVFKDVEYEYIKKEGDGGLSSTNWQLNWGAFFKEQADDCNIIFNEDSKIVLEEFQLMYK